jgi:hypothetical protein
VRLRGRERGPAFLQALGSIMAISTGARAPISYWEVNAALPYSSFPLAA